MFKYIIISLILIFITVTILIFNTDTPTGKPVTFSAKNFNITNKNNLQIEDVKTNTNSVNINNKNIVNEKNISFKSAYPYKGNEDTKNVEKNNFTPHNWNYNQNENKNSNNNESDNDYSLTISWNQWRSNIVNKILDDSYSIQELNKYPSGTWFYYSFNVDREGNIFNINVISFTMEPQDIQLVTDLIKSYTHAPLIVFPKNSKRNKVSVRAVCLFDNQTQATQSSDFHDLERLKF